MSLSLSGLSRLDVGIGRHRNGRSGAKLGFVGGAAIGGLIKALESEDSNESSFCGVAGESNSACRTNTKILSVIGEALIDGGTAAVLGAIAGHFVRTDDWAPVAVRARPTRIGLAAPRRLAGTGLGLSVSF